jgi:RHS repeat-associated protein
MLYLSSVRSTSNEYGLLEDRYEYDAFGKPYKGDLESGMNLGYTGKPYDTATGMYNYGYRDYKPEQARFTTVDPIRDGNNWFAYVNGDPVNYTDLWGLKPVTITDRLYPGDSGVGNTTGIPPYPPGVDIDANIERAKGMTPGQFYDAVKNGGEWDYKQQGHQYEDFGNFNFGATGKAAGFPDFVLERGAGWAQTQAGTSDPNWGNPLGKAPYGDDPKDQAQIKAGIDYYNSTKNSNCSNK